MEQDFWHQRWHQKEIGFHQPTVNAHLARFWEQLHASPGGRVFVPLCGKSLDMLWLRDQGWQVIGVELSNIAVAEFFQESGLTPEISREQDFTHYRADGIELLCGDFFQLSASHLAGVTAVYDRASLVALPPAMRVDYARHMASLLPAGTPTLLVSFDYDQSEAAGPPFAVKEAEIRQLYPHCRLEPLHQEDMLAGMEGARWRERGVSGMVENVQLLLPKQA